MPSDFIHADDTCNSKEELSSFWRKHCEAVQLIKVESTPGRKVRDSVFTAVQCHPGCSHWGPFAETKGGDVFALPHHNVPSPRGIATQPPMRILRRRHQTVLEGGGAPTMATAVQSFLGRTHLLSCRTAHHPQGHSRARRHATPQQSHSHGGRSVRFAHQIPPHLYR